MRVALGVAYRGQAYLGWQSQPGGQTVQDRLEAALSRFLDRPVRTHCAGRTDTGVHALNQVVHLDAEVVRAAPSWVRGTNRYLPPDIAVQWAQAVPDTFHVRFSAHGRRYAYVLLRARCGLPSRPGRSAGRFGTSQPRIEAAAALLLGQHDFSAFRSAECQAASPVKTLRRIDIHRRGAYWRFEFDADAYLHHMIRNLMGSLLAVGSGVRDVAWLADVLASRERARAAPTFSADGLYFVGPYYDSGFAIPGAPVALDWLP